MSGPRRFGNVIVNPLLPSVYDVVWSLVAVIVVALAVVALVSLARAGALEAAFVSENSGTPGSLKCQFRL